MKQLSISVDDDFYNLLDFYRRIIFQLTDVERSMEDFLMLLCGLGMTSLGTALTPKTEEEIREVTLSLISGAPEKANFMQQIYKLTKAQREKKLGYPTESKNLTP